MKSRAGLDGELRMSQTTDFLDELIEERTERNPGFLEMVDVALERRQLLHALAAEREELGLSQVAVAHRMGTSQSAVARIEAGEVDARLSTVQRYAQALGRRIEWTITLTGTH